jgi:hypothetical protein
MRDAMADGNWQLARQHSQKALVAHPDDPDLMTDAAKVAAMCDRKREAARLMADAAALAGYEASRVDFAVHALIDVGELYEAIELLERSVAVHATNNTQRHTLVGFLCEVQRNELIEPHFETLIRNRSFDLQFLVATTESTSRQFSPKTVELMLERNPEDRRVRLGEALNIGSRSVTGRQTVINKRKPREPIGRQHAAIRMTARLGRDWLFPCGIFEARVREKSTLYRVNNSTISIGESPICY